MESFYGRISRIDRDCQAVRREGGIIHHREGQYQPFSASWMSAGHGAYVAKMYTWYNQLLSRLEDFLELG
jgi:hypothetical protein